MGTYKINKTNNGQFRWTLVASNGEKLITSETYTAKQGCLNGIESSKKCGAEKNFEKKASSSGQPYFNQLAGNHQVLGTSQMYSSEQARDAGIDSVKSNIADATVEDLS